MSIPPANLGTPTNLQKCSSFSSAVSKGEKILKRNSKAKWNSQESGTYEFTIGGQKYELKLDLVQQPQEMKATGRSRQRAPKEVEMLKFTITTKSLRDRDAQVITEKKFKNGWLNR
jgi:hypothetical protein